MEKKSIPRRKNIGEIPIGMSDESLAVALVVSPVVEVRRENVRNSCIHLPH